MKTKTIIILFQLLTLNLGTAQQYTPPVKGVGVVVKKNPGSGASKINGITNVKGETTVQIPENGNYKIYVYNSSTSETQKTAGENDGVKGVKIGLAKHPGNYFIKFVNTNDKGEAEFKDLEPGSYTIKVESATTNCPPGMYNLNGTCIPNEPRNPTTTTTNYVGHVTLLRYSQWYLGGGLIMPSTSTKTAGLVNGIDINLGYYYPIWAWDKSKISLGVHGELGYTMGQGNYDLNNQYTVYPLAGQVKEPLITENSSSTKSTSFRGVAGAQLNVHLGKWIISPIMNAAYLSTSQKAYSVDETIYPQGNPATYRLFNQLKTNTSGLGFLPKLRFTYMLSPRIGVWLEGNYAIGYKIKTENTRFVIDPTLPFNNINEGNFQEGTYITTKNEASYAALGFNGGIVVNLGKNIKSKILNQKEEFGDPKPVGTNFIDNPCYEIIKTLYCYDGNNNCKLICDNVNNSFCGMYTFKKEIPCNTSTPTGTVNLLIKTYIFDPNSSNPDELSYGEIKAIVNDILPSFTVENITLNSYKDHYLLLVEGNQNKISANINIMLSNEKGKLYTTDDIRVLECSDPNGIKPSAKRKHDYVGHVTLLK